MKYIQAYHRSPGGNTSPFRQVIHATCPPQPSGAHWSAASAAGQAEATARYFQQPSSGGSAHFVGDVGEIVQCLPEDAVAWHAPPNPHTLGYEVCGQSWYTREQWLSSEVWPAVELVAAQVRADAHAHGIPIRRLSVAEVAQNAHGQCGHVDVSRAFHQSDHTDPGPGFPWPEFMALLEGPVQPVEKKSGGVSDPAGMSGTPPTSSPADSSGSEDVMTPEQEKKLDDLAALVKALHDDHKVMIHGGVDHPYSLDSIAKQVGVVEGQ